MAKRVRVGLRLGVVLLSGLAVFGVLLGTVGAPQVCSDTGNFWHLWPGPLCRGEVLVHEPSVIYAIPLAIVLVVWLFKKIRRTKDAA